MLEFVAQFLTRFDDQTIAATVFGAIFIITAILAAGHAILYKRDPRAALLWIGLILLSPLLGSVLYYIFGINRIKRAAQQLREPKDPETIADYPVQKIDLPPAAERFASYGDRILDTPMTAGNDIKLLVNGDEAYPAMLDAIMAARQSVTLSTYIFDNDAIGRQFVSALADARRRGVEVRVLIDGVGASYSFPTILGRMRRANITAARFLPPWRLGRLALINMRSHRKLLCVDGQTAFCGGMNIRAGHVLSNAPSHPVADIHFAISGPVVTQLQRVFASDWRFATKEILTGKRWFPAARESGAIAARSIPDGPDEHFEKIRWLIMGALSLAQKKVRIMTPYFIPDTSLATAMNTASLRGVEIDLVLPAKNNLPWMHWATMALLWQVVEKGCRVYLSPEPFNHAKLMVVDDIRVQFGSANWDARSLRLNFELDIECLDANLARKLDAHVQDVIDQSQALTLADLDARPASARLKHGIARLFAPIL